MKKQHNNTDPSSTAIDTKQLKELLAKDFDEFKNKYRATTSADWQTFIIGWNKCAETLAKEVIQLREDVKELADGYNTYFNKTHELNLKNRVLREALEMIVKEAYEYAGKISNQTIREGKTALNNTK